MVLAGTHPCTHTIFLESEALENFYLLNLLLSVDGRLGRASRRPAGRPHNRTGDGVWNDDEHEYNTQLNIPLAEYVSCASTLHPSRRFFVLPLCHCFLGR